MDQNANRKCTGNLEEDRALLRSLLPRGAEFELCEAGFYGHRKRLGRGAAYRSLEEFFADRPLRVFDFNMGVEDLVENLHDGNSFQSDYRGFARGDSGRIFRVDHHFEVDDLRSDSTTPMVLRWLLALHDDGDRETLKTVAEARYLADHCDVDIIFSHHLARHAADRSYLEEVGPAFAAGALINDYGGAPEGSDQRADQAYFAGLALETEITDGRLAFADVQDKWLPALGAWLAGEKDDETTEQLAIWEKATRESEEAILETIEAWRGEGRLRVEMEGRLAVLEAPEEIDNLSLFSYLARRMPLPGHRVQLLSFPSDPGSDLVTYKIRSHAGFDLNPLYPALEEALPGASWGGRSAAGGSGKPQQPETEGLMEVLRGAFRDS
jgi:hypothetical protein